LKTAASILPVLIVYLILSPAAWAFSPDEGDLSGPLTLERAISIALERNAGIRAAVEATRGAELNIRIAERQRFPRVDAEAWYEEFPIRDKLLTPRHMDIPTLGDLAAPTPEASTQKMLNFFDTQFQDRVLNLGGSLKVPLYTGGRIAAQIDAAKGGRDRTRAGLRQIQDNLIFNVAQTFYRILQLEKLKEANEVAVGNLVESKRIVGKFVEMGRAPRLDLLRIETRLANVRQKLIRANNAIEVAQAHLKTLMGLEAVTQGLTLEGALTYQPREADLAASLEEALTKRPAYQALSAEVRAREARVKEAFSERLPQLTLTGRYSVAHGNNTGGPIDAWESDATIMASLSLPIFDGGLIRSKVAKRRSGLEQQKYRLAGLRLAIQFEVQQAYQNLIEAGERVKNSEVALVAARESLQIEQFKLEVGKGIVNDVLDAQADQLKAEVNYAEALADHRVALAALDRATGGAVEKRSGEMEE